MFFMGAVFGHPAKRDMLLHWLEIWESAPIHLWGDTVDGSEIRQAPVDIW